MTPISLEDMAASVPDGALIALPPDYSLPPCSLGRALIRRGARNLRVLGVPITGFVTDLLVGAGLDLRPVHDGHPGRRRAAARAPRGKDRIHQGGGVNLTLVASPNTAAATARQKSASMPCQSPLSSGAEKPARPVETPHWMKPLALTSSSVAADAAEATNPSAAAPRMPIAMCFITHRPFSVFFRRT